MSMRIPAGLGILLALNGAAFALDGEFRIHDPSTLVQCDGKFHTYGTGGACPITEDGWTRRHLWQTAQIMFPEDR